VIAPSLFRGVFRPMSFVIVATWIERAGAILPYLA
jgi:hypothetical protein